MTIYHDKLKQIKEQQNLEFARISFNNNIVVLRPVDDSDDTISLLTEWRNRFWDAFPAKFTATFSGTKEWLHKQVYEKNDRILFLIYLNEQKIGHIGTYRYDECQNSAEIDNVLRAIRGNFPGLMEKVTRFMIDWMFKELNLSLIKLKVFSDNYKAINLYERCGMKTTGIIPLKRVFTNDGWLWDNVLRMNEYNYAERYFSIMEIKRID